MRREDLEKIELEILAPYASKSAESRGRHYPEPKHPYRTEFQRDRDRIVHSTAFRRLQYKTQVFVNHEGDHYRTRLTHTIEVDIISRTVARTMRLNEDLSEALALAHDLGHTPFGHAGEDALNELLSDRGGFEHNRQCLRVIDILESRYPDFPGLNLTFELREGILKHHADFSTPDIPEDLRTDHGPSLESQVVNIADEIAYNCHDVDDGLASGILDEKRLGLLDVWQKGLRKIARAYPKSDDRMRRHSMVRFLINYFVSDLIDNSTGEIERIAPPDADFIKKNRLRPISFSKAVGGEIGDLKSLLREDLYKNERLIEMAENARNIVRRLYFHYLENPSALPDNVREKVNNNSVDLVIADYIAGMTDRFAASECEKASDSRV